MGCSFCGTLSWVANVSCWIRLSVGITLTVSASANKESLNISKSTSAIESSFKSNASAKVGKRKFHLPIYHPPSGTTIQTTPSIAITVHTIYAICLGLIELLLLPEHFGEEE